MIKLQLGFTDVEETDDFVYDEHYGNEKNVRYNIVKQSDENEKAMIEWELNTDIPAVRNAIQTWENTIRRPHLSMVQLDKFPYALLPMYDNISITLQFINLIPLTVEPELFSNEDFEHSVAPANRQYGDLEFAIHGLYNEAGFDFEETTEWAIGNDSLEKYNLDSVPLSLPYFKIDFHLGRSTNVQKRKKDIRVLKFLKKHQDQLKELGITEDEFLQKYGKIIIGKMLTDPHEAHDILTTYTRICRTSITDKK